MPDILHRVGINAPAQKVYAALSEDHGLAGWWTQDTRASPSVGAINRFRFGDEGYNAMEVTELIPGQRVKWKCVEGGTEWIGTEVIFDLRDEKGITVVFFAQRGWREQVEFMHYCSTKWATYMLSLKFLCETGKGRPYPDDIDIG